MLLNDPTYVEAARNFAARVLSENKGSSEERITHAWQLALQRNPRVEEMKTIRELLEKHLEIYRQDAKAAEELLKVGFAPVPSTLDKAELAAWVHVARVLLNLHETVTRS